MFFCISLFFRSPQTTLCAVDTYVEQSLIQLQNDMSQISDNIEQMEMDFDEEFTKRFEILSWKYKLATEESKVRLIQELYFVDLISFYDRQIWRINMKICELDNTVKELSRNHNLTFFDRTHEIQTKCKLNFKFRPYPSFLKFEGYLSEKIVAKTKTSVVVLNHILYFKNNKEAQQVTFDDKNRFYKSIYALRKKGMANSLQAPDKNVQENHNFRPLEYYRKFFGVYLLKEYLQSKNDDTRFISFKKFLNDLSLPQTEYFKSRILHNEPEDAITLTKILDLALSNRPIFLDEYFKYISYECRNKFAIKYDVIQTGLVVFMRRHGVLYEINRPNPSLDSSNNLRG